MNNTQPTPEFLSQNSGPVLIAVASVFMVLVILVAGLRYVAQQLRQRPFGLDDLFSYIGLVFIIGECILSFCAFNYPSFWHLSTPPNIDISTSENCRCRKTYRLPWGNISEKVSAWTRFVISYRNYLHFSIYFLKAFDPLDVFENIYIKANDMVLVPYSKYSLLSEKHSLIKI